MTDTQHSINEALEEFDGSDLIESVTGEIMDQDIAFEDIDDSP